MLLKMSPKKPQKAEDSEMEVHLSTLLDWKLEVKWMSTKTIMFDS